MSSRIDPQLAEAVAKNESLAAALGAPGNDIHAVRAHFMATRAWWNEGGPRMAIDRDDVVPLSAGHGLRAAVYAAEAPGKLRPAYVYLHGGGFRVGGPRSSDRQLRELAAAWGGVVLSLDYAHMPEAVFPTAVEETAAAIQWLHSHGAAWGIDGDRLAVGGSSAGANVAMGACVQLGGSRPGFLRAGAFVVGVFDDDLDTESMHEHGHGALFPSRASASALFPVYAGGPGQRQDPRFNARRSDLGALPPLFLAAAELDVYRDSSVHLAQEVRERGGRAEARVYPGMTHLYWGYSRMVETASRCTADLAAFLRRELPA